MLSQGYFLNAYEISSVIGRGGFGIVYKGKHRELGIEVAIKEYFPSELCIRHGQTVLPSKPEFQDSYEESLDRFVREAKQLEKFRDCPNIVTCRDLFRDNGTAYIIMDYIHGLPLSVLLERREANGEPFTEQDLLQVILPLLNGLQTVHESGVCHRDIKPSNILIRSSDRTPVLIDFGAAKHEMSMHTKSFAPYSDGYAAMEQVGEGEIGPWTDVYGVGAVMWRIIAGGAPPFSPPNPLTSQKRAFELMHGQTDPLPSAIEIGRDRFSDSVLQAVDDCLMINVNDRVQNCSEILERISPDWQVDIQNLKSNREAESFKQPELSRTGTKNGKNRTETQFETYNAGRSRKKSNRGANLGSCLGKFAKIVFTMSLIGLTGGLIWQLTLKITERQRVEEWQVLAESGNAEAQHNLGYAYYSGGGVDQNREEGVRWLRLAAEQGHPMGQADLGNAYYTGQGITKNVREAARWYLEAANQGHAEAAYCLGEIFRSSDSVEENPEEAARWYRQAAELGLDKSAISWGWSSLASMYKRRFEWADPVVIGDATEYYVWASLAHTYDNFHDPPTPSLNPIRYRRYEMTATQVRAAQDRALEIFNEIEIARSDSNSGLGTTNTYRSMCR